MKTPWEDPGRDSRWGGRGTASPHPAFVCSCPQIKKAFFAMVANGVRAAPLWDSKKQSFVGEERWLGNGGRDAPWWKNTSRVVSSKSLAPRPDLAQLVTWQPCRHAHHHRLHPGVAPLLPIPPGEFWGVIFRRPDALGLMPDPKVPPMPLGPDIRD